jgi:competence protein ComEC
MHPPTLLATAQELALKWLLARPLVTAAIGFAAGIAVCKGGATGISLAVFLVIVLLLWPGQTAWLRRVAATSSVLGVAWGWLAFHPAANDISHLLGSQRVKISGVLVDAPERHKYGWTALLSVDSASGPNSPPKTYAGMLKVWLGGDEALPPPQAGDRLTLTGELQTPQAASFEGGFEETSYLRTQGIFATVRVRSARDWRIEGMDHSVSSIAIRGAASLRQDLLDRLGHALPKAEAGLLAGIMLGSRSTLPPVISDDMAQAGISHITASSGTNVAFAALCVVWIATRLGFSRRMRSVAGIIGVTLYTILAGATPSVVRADLMATIILAAGLLDREPDVGCALAAAALISLAWHPGDLFNPGFQLSYACVIGLVAAAPIFQSLRERAKTRWLQPADHESPWLVKQCSLFIDTAAATVAAQFASGPILMQVFNVAPLAGFLANGLALWNVFVLMAAGFVLWPLLAYVPSLGAILAVPVGWLLSYEIGVARWCAGLPFSAPSIASLGLPLIILIYGSLGFAILLMHARFEIERRQKLLSSIEVPAREVALV